MTYRATNESSTLTAAERGAEARKIVIDMNLAGESYRMAPSEQQFVERLANDLEIATPDISVKQLWWLRDLKDRYL